MKKNNLESERLQQFNGNTYAGSDKYLQAQLVYIYYWNKFGMPTESLFGSEIYCTSEWNGFGSGN